MIALVFEGFRVNGKKLWRAIRVGRRIASDASASTLERMPHHLAGGRDHTLAEVPFEPIDGRDRRLRRQRARRKPVTADLRDIRALDANWRPERDWGFYPCAGRLNARPRSWRSDPAAPVRLGRLCRREGLRIRTPSRRCGVGPHSP